MSCNDNKKVVENNIDIKRFQKTKLQKLRGNKGLLLNFTDHSSSIELLEAKNLKSIPY